MQVLILIPGHVANEIEYADSDLPEVVQANHTACAVLSLAELREKHGSKDRNNRDHHEQFDQGEGGPVFQAITG